MIHLQNRYLKTIKHKAIFFFGSPGSYKYEFMRQFSEKGIVDFVEEKDWEASPISKFAFQFSLLNMLKSGALPGKKEFYLQIKSEFFDTVAKLKFGQAPVWFERGHSVAIDSDGRDYEDVVEKNSILHSLGYDTEAYFFDTSLKAALRRNNYTLKYYDTVPEVWREVDANKDKFANLFKNNINIIENFTDLDTGELHKFNEGVCTKLINSMESPVKNLFGRLIETEMTKKSIGSRYDLFKEGKPLV